jgi:ubiquinone/menaquinone biosynthesis C-methylase UbiE
MLSQIFSIPTHVPSSKKFFWTKWYNLFASMYPEVNIAFMNYGYADIDGKKISLNSEDEIERYCLQLYHHVASSVSFQGLDVLEVGCGRGGGSSYIKRYLEPKSMTGIDISEKNVELCRNKYSIPQLSFNQGDAESLSFADAAFDAVINIESSHCYRKIGSFFSEVFRVLRPEGYFLFSDFRPKHEINLLNDQLTNAGFKMVKHELITRNILESMNCEHDRKLNIIKRNIPKIFHGVAQAFSGIQGTFMYEDLKNGKQEYFCCLLQKT